MTALVDTKAQALHARMERQEILVAALPAWKEDVVRSCLCAACYLVALAQMHHCGMLPTGLRSACQLHVSPCSPPQVPPFIGVHVLQKRRLTVTVCAAGTSCGRGLQVGGPSARGGTVAGASPYTSLHPSAVMLHRHC